MKKILYTLSVVLAVSTFCACDDSDEMGILYNPANTEAIFTSGSSAYFYTSADPGEYSITVQRANSKGNAEVAIELQDETGLFTTSATVLFEDGSLESTLTVSFEKDQLEIGTPYSITLELPELAIAGKQTSHVLTVTRDYTWELYKEEVKTVTFINGESVASIERAKENQSYYKIKNLYSEGHELKLLIAGDGSISMLQDVNSNGYYDIVTGYKHPSYGMVYTYFDADPEYSYFNSEENLIVLSMYYYVGAGAFGWKDDVIYLE